MINIQPRHLEIIQSILSKYPYKFYLFGSRTTLKVKKFSDVDLFYKEKIPDTVLVKIIEDFEESDLPYKVDLVDYSACDETFKKAINQHQVLLSSPLSL
ncbi:MAG: nucleotidyltransferase domain-containing protein [Alphaproteobacteria bacterium]|nr:nucleotidyltransferase domain-containing protein [Alphaproteobacteria bacterium]